MNFKNEFKETTYSFIRKMVFECPECKKHVEMAIIDNQFQKDKYYEDVIKHTEELVIKKQKEIDVLKKAFKIIQNSN